MRNHKLNYVIVGLFVVTMLAAAGITAMVLTGRTGESDSYYLVLDNVADVRFGTQVRYEGFPIGQVEEITPFAEGGAMRFRLDLSVTRGWRIPEDSIARIGSSSFLAAKTIDVESGRAEMALAPDSEIPGAPPIDIFAAMTGVAAELSDLTRGSVKPLIEKIGGLADTADGMLGHDLAGLIAILSGLARSLEGDIPRITASIMDFTGQLNAGAASAREILSDENVTAIGRVLRNVEETSETFAGIGASLMETSLKIDGLVANLESLAADNRGEVDATIQDARYILGSIARNIDSINHNLEGSARNMNEFSRLIRQNPSLLLGGTPREEVAAPPRRAPASRPPSSASSGWDQ